MICVYPTDCTDFCPRLRSAGSLSGQHLDERPHDRRIPGAEAGGECDQLDRDGDKRCHFPKMAVSLIVIS